MGLVKNPRLREFKLYKQFTYEKFDQNSATTVWQGYVESNHDLRFWRPLY